MTFGLGTDLLPFEPLPAPPEDIRSILCVPWASNRLLEWVKAHLDDSHNNRTLVFTGKEMPISMTWGNDAKHREDMAKQFKKYFNSIYYYVTDVAVKGVKTLPMGFIEQYLQSRTDELLDAWMQTNTSDTWKVHSILAAWGLYTPGLEGTHYEYGKDSSKGWGMTWSRAWVDVANDAIDIRNDANGWMDSPESQATGVEKRNIERAQWWTELSKYKFILVPLGSAIQCSKVPEALSMLTIPIIKRGPFQTHDDIVRMGFPIVVVEAWAEITPESMERWWRILSPMLLDFRERCLSTEGYWRLLTQGSCMPDDQITLVMQISSVTNDA